MACLFCGDVILFGPFSVTQPIHNERSFWQNSNDLQCRGWPHRLIRFLRARLRNGCAKGLLLADDPRVIQAWRRGWETDHYVRLRRWHDEGFRPQFVYDIGAHTGLWSEMCQAIFAPKKILLFEPQSEHHEKARARQPQPGADWQVVPVALGEKDETNLLHVTQNAAASSLLPPLPAAVPKEWGTEAVRQKEVQVATLDGLVAREKLPLPDLVKIDVQGYEGRVIAGGKNALAHAERIIVEVSLRAIYREQALLPDILQTLAGWGFALDDWNETCREWAGPLWQTDLWLTRSK